MAQKNMVQAVNEALDQIMESDEKTLYSVKTLGLTEGFSVPLTAYTQNMATNVSLIHH